MRTQVDTQQVNTQADLLALAGRDTDLKRVASTGGGEFAGPCPFCGGRDRFRVQPNHEEGGRWFCRGCGGGRWHDAIDYVQQTQNVDFLEAVRLIGGEQLPQQRAQRPVKKKPADLERPPTVDWQSAALTAVHEAADRLHDVASPEAQAARAYLRQHRGLTRETIFRATLGYNPAWREVAPDVWLPPGITIPCLVDADLWYVQVRTTKAARRAAKRRGRELDKYHAMTGSRLKALYNANQLDNAERAVIVEGEFDALLLGQYAPAGWAVVTMGSANSWPGLRWRLSFGHLKGLYLALDQDAAGSEGAAKWEQWRRVLPDLEPMPAAPAGGKDITDYWQNGADLGAWIRKAMAKDAA